jgi:KDO2-lipid IV(A) lauroyltransferase
MHPSPSSDRISLVLSVVVRTAAEICARMPAGMAAGLASIGGHIEWATRPGKRRRLAENLAHATSRTPDDPYVRRLVHRNVTTGARRAAGLLWAFARPGEAAARIPFSPPDLLDRLIADGHGVVLVSAHFGAFEAAAATTRNLPAGTRLAVVTDESAIGRGMHPIRERMGLEIVPADGSLLELLRILRGGGVVVVVADLHRPGMRGHRVRFLDAECLMPAGAAALARMSQAPLVPFAVYPSGPRRWRLELGPPISPPSRSGTHDDERGTTQELADALTTVIRRAPEQWDAVDPIPWVDADPT